MPQPLAVTAFMASPGRFELPAPRLGGVCSIQLSYGDIFDFSWSRMERSASQDFDDLIIRRRPLYPTELRGLIQKIFNFQVQPDSNELPLRRRPLYPTELRGLIQKLFTFTGLQDSNDSIFRRRPLYPTELRGHMGDIQTVRCTVGFLPGYTRFFYFTCFSSPCQSGGGPPQKNREPLKQRLPAEGAFAAYSITRTRMTLGRCLTSSMTLSATLEPRSTMV